MCNIWKDCDSQMFQIKAQKVKISTVKKMTGEEMELMKSFTFLLFSLGEKKKTGENENIKQAQNCSLFIYI